MTLSFGLFKVGEASLVKCMPIFLIFDSALQLAIFLETKIRYRKEKKWMKLVEGKYYHIDTEIGVDWENSRNSVLCIHCSTPERAIKILPEWYAQQAYSDAI